MSDTEVNNILHYLRTNNRWEQMTEEERIREAIRLTLELVREGFV